MRRTRDKAQLYSATFEHEQARQGRSKSRLSDSNKGLEGAAGTSAAHQQTNAGLRQLFEEFICNLLQRWLA